ncbi:DNA mismatch repair endonuclease MutL [[Clostridium] polysaccharolyticum]|uniref:DNA mismatch repair protein MutL n=1 Tax=[Clostridium] polysaccharolyticum TaxID=29364 RepID=A0A1I0E3Z3_9FIRM|nr:DNA mismatch repair endonuclease MutL [[Clostridium] polysaccharolyticum]SET39491.1 DNA mismatch repair protein MutL [[Clostridium] polysaccharolyticum]
MAKITCLDSSTINQIAAGEVIERPSAVVKELVENSIDSGAKAITVEIKDGGTSLIRITDNGCGIEKEEISLAFMRHATSKIRSADDLLKVMSLGFRGEALASIASIAQVEVITKTPEDLTGVRYRIEGGEEKGTEEIGCPDGTTFLVRNLFFNTPARKKFLKSNNTETGYINDLVERLAVSHPNIAFKFISKNQTRLHTSGNGNMKDILYHIYGRDIAKELLPIETQDNVVRLSGFIGKPVVSRGTKALMNYYVNGRYVKSLVIHKAIEEAYKPYSMTHRYPFTSLMIEVAPEWIDVNVHPAKMEVRFHDSQVIYEIVYKAIRDALRETEFIPEVTIDETKAKKPENTVDVSVPEPFEKQRMADFTAFHADRPQPVKEEYGGINQFFAARKERGFQNEASGLSKAEENLFEGSLAETVETNKKPEQVSLFEGKLLAQENIKKHHIIGQLFKTYWIVEFEDKMYLIDQHAAHEKVLYERNMENLKKKTGLSQMVNPPIIVTLSLREEIVLKNYLDRFKELGFEIEPFGGKEYAIYGVPADLLGLDQEDIFLELLDSFMEEKTEAAPDMILHKVATMSCKAAVKGNSAMTLTEAQKLIEELLTLENPYHCPHGRPVIVSMSKYEIEKKFKRIV